MKKVFVIICLLLLVQPLYAAIVDTVSIYSDAMRHTRKCVVIKPESKKKNKNFPVVYLLHGYSGNYSNWITGVPDLKKYADLYQLIIVCPDGDYSSWYFDSPVDRSMRFETYIGKEVPAYIDAHYPTIKSRKARAITGLSMGGHGAFFIALRRADFFGACGSMSGVMDLYTSRKRFDIMKRIGDTIQQATNWKKYSILHAIEKVPKISLAILFDCGDQDIFFADNKKLHEKMNGLKIPHEFIARSGNHNWNYWAQAVPYQLLFFKKFFDRKKAP